MTSLSARVSSAAFYACQAFRKLLPSFLKMRSRSRGRAAMAGAFALLLLVGSAGRVSLQAQTAQFSNAIVTLGGSFQNPQGVAVDRSGNVYVAASEAGFVYELTPGCASASCVTTLGGGFRAPSGVAVDGSGN